VSVVLRYLFPALCWWACRLRHEYAILRCKFRATPFRAGCRGALCLSGSLTAASFLAGPLRLLPRSATQLAPLAKLAPTVFLQEGLPTLATRFGQKLAHGVSVFLWNGFHSKPDCLLYQNSSSRAGVSTP